MMQTFGSVASVVAAIREDAAAEVERIEQQTTAETAALGVIPSASEESPADRETRIAAAHRAVAEALAQQEWEGRRALIEQREAWMARVVAAAQGRCDLDALVREATERVGGPATLSYPPDGGCIATAGDVAFDNSLAARARRLEPEWRSALASLYRLEAS